MGKQKPNKPTSKRQSRRETEELMGVNKKGLHRKNGAYSNGSKRVFT